MEYAPLHKRSVDVPYILSVVLLASLFTVFAGANFMAWRETGRPVGLGITMLEGMAAVLFIVRRRAQRSSRSPAEWLITCIASFAMLLARPAFNPIGGLEGLYVVLQFTGVAIAIVGLGCLGRSFGLVPANRGIKVGGAYRFVRHPAYAGYLISYSGYILENPSPWNIGIFCVATAFQLVRIQKEEAFLASDPEYAVYRERVRYRLIPFLY